MNHPDNPLRPDQRLRLLAVIEGNDGEYAHELVSVEMDQEQLDALLWLADDAERVIDV